MWTRVLVALIALVVGTQHSWANDPKKATIQELQREMESLKKERNARIKAVADMFQYFSHTDKFTEKELDQHRRRLIAQRDQLLKFAGKDEERAAIHSHYDPIIKKLGGKERFEQKQIEDLRGEEKQMIALLRKHYDAAINRLQKQIDASKHQPPAKPVPKPIPNPKPKAAPKPTSKSSVKR